MKENCLFCKWFIIVAFLATACATHAQNLQVVMSADKSQADIDSREMFEFTIQYNCASTTTDAFSAQLTDTLPSSVEVIGIVGSPHVASSSIVANTVTFDFIEPLPAGATGDLIIQCRFYETTPSNTIINNDATITSANMGSATSNSVQVEGIDGWDPPAYTSGVSINKSGYGTSGLSDDWSYYITHGNTGSSGSDLTNYQVEDTLPAGVQLEYFDTGEFPGTSNSVNVFYQKNASTSWLAWPGNPLATTDAEKRFYASDLGLGAGEFVSGIRFNLGTVPGGGAFYPNVPGSEGIKLKASLVDPSAFNIGDKIDNCATVAAGGYNANDCHIVTLTSDYGSFAYVDGASMDKWANTSNQSALQSLTYQFDHGNTGASGSDLSSYLVEDLAPPGVEIETFSTGSFPGPSIPIQVNYRTNTAPAWTAWSGSFSSGNESWIHDYHLPLGAGEYVTGFQLVFGTLPGGGGYHPESSGQSAVDVRMRVIDPSAWSAGDLVTNCASVSASLNGNPVNPSDCADVTILGAIANFTLYQWEATSDPYLPGENYRVGITYGTDPESGKPMTNPVVAYLLAPEFEYVGNETYYGWAYTDGGSPTPSITVIDDFAGTGRQLLRYAFSPLTIPPNGSWHHGQLEVDLRVKPGTPNGAYLNEAYGTWDPDGEGHWWFVTDSDDVDGDGSTSDTVARSDRYYAVDAGNSTAALDSVMWVKGALDTDWSRFPGSGKTTPAGEADYELRITNTGEVAISNVVIIDILPHVGDKGVIDTSGRGSEWEPYMVSEVTAPAGVSVSYSTSKNPCRDELTPGIPSGCEDPQWTSSPANVGAVKSLKFELGGNIIVPLEEVIIGWAMRAPISAPRTGEIAWNSFGFTGIRTDNGVQLLPSEPVKVGIEVEPPTGSSYGDLVWDDLNNNGVQDLGEAGINGLRVELYRDNGDGVQDMKTDTLEQFTLTTADGATDGAYLFTNLSAGDFYAVVEAPSGFTPSLTQAQQPTPGALVTSTGDFEGAIPDWAAYGGATVQQHDSSLDTANDGNYYLWVTDRSGNSGAQVSGNTLQSGATYAIKFVMKMESSSNIVIVDLYNNGSKVDTFNYSVDPGFNNSGPWNAVSGSLTTPASLSSSDFTLVIRPGSTEEFKLDSFSMSGPPASSKDSDGVADSKDDMVVAKMPITTMMASGDAQLDWDQGFVAKAGLPSVWAMKEDGSGRILIGGSFVRSHGIVRPNIARLMSNGSLDESFNPGSGPNGTVRSLDIRPDGRILIAGSFSNYNGKSTPGGLVLIRPDGTVPGGDGDDNQTDTENITVAQPNSKSIRYVGIDGNGRSMVAGAFDSIGGVASAGIACLKTSGIVDSSFVSGLDPGDVVYTVLPLADGSMMIGGSFDSYGGVPRNNITKIKDDGTLDPDFDPAGGANGPVRQIYVQEDEKFIAVGEFGVFAGHQVSGTVRLKQNGAVDTALGESELAVRRIESSN